MNNLREKIEKILEDCQGFDESPDGERQDTFNEFEAADRLLTLFTEERARVRGLVEGMKKHNPEFLPWNDALDRVLSLLSEPNPTSNE